MVDTLFSLIIIVAVLVVIWWVLVRFSPDPLITKIGQVIIFIVALWLIIKKLLPLVM